MSMINEIGSSLLFSETQTWSHDVTNVLTSTKSAFFITVLRCFSFEFSGKLKSGKPGKRILKTQSHAQNEKVWFDV